LARRNGGAPRYGLSARGDELIEEGTRRIYGHHRAAWDGRWLLVSYSLPEPRRGQRDRLRQGLSFLGLRSLGNGLFGTPPALPPTAPGPARAPGRGAPPPHPPAPRGGPRPPRPGRPPRLGWGAPGRPLRRVPPAARGRAPRGRRRRPRPDRPRRLPAPLPA